MSHLSGKSKEESDAHFLKKIQTIVSFLERAYTYELGNEIKWANVKVRELTSIFDEDVKNIPEIQEIITMI